MGKSATSLPAPISSVTTSTSTRSAVSQPKARRKLVVSETLEEVVLPPPVPLPGKETEAERDSSGVVIASSDDGALLFSTG